MPPVSLRTILPISPKTRTESERVEPILIESLASPISLERKRMEARVLNIAKEETETMVTVLLRQMEAKNFKARDSIDRLLKEIAQSREGKAAILENLSHPDKQVRKSVRIMMVEIWGEPAGTFATSYEQVIFYINLAKGREIYVEDMITLADLSKVTLLEGDVEKAVGDISLIVDLIKHRYRAVETMKNYLAEMLRTTPELTKLGMLSGRIEQSLNNAMRANKQRTFEYTKDLIDERMKEMGLVDQVRALGVIIKDQLEDAPQVPLEQMNVLDVWVFTRLKEVVRECSSMNVTDRKSDVIGVVNSFLEEEFFPYLRDRAQDRLTSKDISLLFVIYTVGLACLKLVSEPLPKVAEELYVTYFRGLEGSPSISSVSWPSTVL